MLYRITNTSPHTDDIFTPTTVPADKTTTVLQAKPEGTPFLEGWQVSFSGPATESVMVELVEVDAPAVATPLTDDQITACDEYAVRHRSDAPHRFGLDADDPATGHSATDEGQPTEVRLIDAAMLPANGSHSLSFGKGAVQIGGNNVVRVRVKATQPVSCVTSLTIKF